jgi:hypothetical protein
MRKISKIMVKSHIAYPHEYDELAKNLNNTIEDDLKWRAEFANEGDDNMKYWKIYVGGTRAVFPACNVETAVKRAIKSEKGRLKIRGKEIGKKLSIMKSTGKLEIYVEETTKSYYDELIKANLPKESAENDKKEDELHG